MQRIFLKQASSFTTILYCAIVCTGFIVGIYGDSSSPISSSGNGTDGVTFTGVFFGILSSLTTAFHAIVIKESMEVVEGNTLELVWYNNVLSAVAMVPLVLISGEFDYALSFFLESTDESGLLKTFIMGTLVTGLFGYLINVAGFLQIKVTSPVSHMISSAVRGVLQTLIAVWLFGDILTGSRVSGIALVLVGSSWYAYDKSLPKIPAYSKVVDAEERV